MAGQIDGDRILGMNDILFVVCGTFHTFEYVCKQAQ